MDFASGKAMTDDFSTIEMGRDVPDGDAAMEPLGMAVTPLEGLEMSGGDYTVSALVYRGGDPSAYPLVGQEVDFAIVEGPNAGTVASMATDDLGQAAFTYVGDGGAGTDRIEVVARNPKTGESYQNVISVTWMNATPTLEAMPVPLYVEQDNHKYITITPDMVIERAEDVFGNPVDLDAVSVISVTSDEPEDHIGDGSTMQDMLVECPSTVMLRTERMGGDQGRVYTIRYRLTDASGTTAEDVMRIIVVKDGANNDPVAPSRSAGYTVTPMCDRKDREIQF